MSFNINIFILKKSWERLSSSLIILLGSMCFAGQGKLCDIVELVYPEDGAVSYRVLQDFYWSRMGSEVNYDFRIERWNADTMDFEPYLSYEALPESGRLTNSLTLPENRFHPPWFLETLSTVELNGQPFIRAPVIDPGFRYRWSVRISGGGEECWSSRILDIAMDPNNRVGFNSHLTMPEEWWGALGFLAPSQEEIQAFAADLSLLAGPYLFEGALQAWGRDAFRVQSRTTRPAYWESDRFLESLNTEIPVIISQNMFQPYRVQIDGGGIPQTPILGTDFFTMFDPSGEDAAFLDPVDFSVLPQYAFSRHDPRTRAVFLFDVIHLEQPLTWHNLWDYWEQIYCAYHAWRVDPGNSDKRQAILDSMAAYQADAQNFTYAPRMDIQEAFASYVSESVARYKDRVSIWHFGNEPNGGWHIDPRLYAHQLAFFSAAVKAADPTARVMAATIFPGNQAAEDGEIFHEGLPDFWWIDQFVDELIQMKVSGTITTLPFDVAGLNFYFIRENSQGRSSADGLGRFIHWGSQLAANCIADTTFCPSMDAQECQFVLFAEFYAKWRDSLDYLTTTFGSPDSIPIIIKETASFSESLPVIEAHMSRGISFLHELGYIDHTGPTPAETRVPKKSSEKRLRNVRSESLIEAVLWFHYHLSHNTNLVEKASFPQQVEHTPLWDDIEALNAACSPKTVDAGPDKKTLCGASVPLGAPEIAQHQYVWLPIEGLDDPTAAEPVANVSTTTTFTLTMTNLCNESVQDDVTVYVIPPLETAFYPLWRAETGLTPELDADDSGRIDLLDFVSYVNSGAGCP